MKTFLFLMLFPSLALAETFAWVERIPDSDIPGGCTTPIGAIIAASFPDAKPLSQVNTYKCWQNYAEGAPEALSCAVNYGYLKAVSPEAKEAMVAKARADNKAPLLETIGGDYVLAYMDESKTITDPQAIADHRAYMDACTQSSYGILIGFKVWRTDAGIRRGAHELVAGNADAAISAAENGRFVRWARPGEM